MADRKVTTEQAHWLIALADAGIHCYVWRPENWPQIEDVLENGPKDEMFQA